MMLQHFYSSFDFGTDEIGLGVNTRSKGKVFMYP